MAQPPRRFYVIAPDGARAVGYDNLEVAKSVAVEFGEGAHVVDTNATVYHPMVMKVEAGEALYQPFGAWPPHRSLDDNLIEAVRKGYAPIVQAFLAKGAAVNSRDRHGGTALHWAVARGVPDIVRLLIAHGAEINAADAKGATALALARQRGKPEIAAMLIEAGAV